MSIHHRAAYHELKLKYKLHFMCRNAWNSKREIVLLVEQRECGLHLNYVIYRHAHAMQEISINRADHHHHHHHHYHMPKMPYILSIFLYVYSGQGFIHVQRLKKNYSKSKLFHSRCVATTFYYHILEVFFSLCFC